jgi:hypothetical protein
MNEKEKSLGETHHDVDADLSSRRVHLFVDPHSLLHLGLASKHDLDGYFHIPPRTVHHLHPGFLHRFSRNSLSPSLKGGLVLSHVGL